MRGGKITKSMLLTPGESDALWRDLGVVGNTLDDNAPLAAVRRAILS